MNRSQNQQEGYQVELGTRGESDTETSGHPDKISKRSRFHLLHHARAVDLGGLLRDTELVRGLFVGEASCDQREHLALTRRE